MNEQVQPLVLVNPRRCEQIASILSAAPVPPSQEEFRLTGLDENLASNVLLLAVSICHQTQALHGEVDGKSLRGWDFLSSRLVLAIRRREFPVEPEMWLSVTASDIASIFSCDKHETAISDPGGRAALIRDLGSTMTAQCWSSLRDPYQNSGRLAIEGTAPMVRSLRHFRAYQDPVLKKSLYLIGLLKNVCGWTFLDEDRLPSPVDYHEVRGHIRLGTVHLQTPELQEKILHGEAVSEDEDVAIRAAVQDAIGTIARLCGGISPCTLHYLFWNLFRNVCLREVPRCVNADLVGTLPERYQYLLRLRSHSPTCPFNEVCQARDSGVYPPEHVFPATNWY